MEKAIYLLTMIFTLALMSTSCEKVDPAPEGIIVEDLVGDWHFESLEFKGEVYTACDDDLNEEYDLITFEVLDVTTTTLRLFSDCIDDDDPNNLDWVHNYTLKNNNLTIGGNYYVFKILNVNDFDNTILRLELFDAVFTNVPIGGVYTLTK